MYKSSVLLLQQWATCTVNPKWVIALSIQPYKCPEYTGTLIFYLKVFKAPPIFIDTNKIAGKEINKDCVQKTIKLTQNNHYHIIGTRHFSVFILAIWIIFIITLHGIQIHQIYCSIASTNIHKAISHLLAWPGAHEKILCFPDPKL